MPTVLSFNIFSRYDGSGVRQARSDINDFDNSTTRSTNSLNSWSGRIALATQAAVTFGPALIPIGIAAAGVGAATAAMAASAGAALGIYGLALKSAIKSASDLAKDGDKNAQAYVKSTNSMSDAWKKLIAATTGDTLKPAAIAVDGITAAIGKLKPILDAMGPVVTKVATDFKNWASGSGMDKFVNTIVQYGVPALKNLVDAGEKVLSVLGTAFRTLAPEGLKLSEAIDKGAKALKGWADGGGFTRFLDKVHQVAPSVTQFFDDLGRAFKKVAEATAGLSSPSLIFADMLAKLVANTPVPVLQGIAIAFVAIKTAMAGIAAYEAVAGAFAAGSTAAAIATALWSAAQSVLLGVMIAFDVAVAPALGIMALIVVALAAVGFGIYELVQHWAGFTHAMGTAWRDTWGVIKTVGEAIWNGLKIAWQSTVSALQTAWTAVSGALKAAWDATWNALKTAATTVWNALKTAWTAAVNGLTTAWNTTSNALKTAWTTVWNALKTAATTVWNALTTAWKTFTQALATAWTTTSNALKTAWQTVWNALKTAAQAVWTALTTAWKTFTTALTTAWTTTSNALKTAWTTVWNAIKTAATTVWNALKTAWTTFLNGLKTVWTTVSNAIKTAWQTFWNALKTAAQTVWNAMKTAWQTFLNGIKQVWDTVSSALKTAWQATWDWLKSTAQTVWDAIKTAWKTLTDGIKQIWDDASKLIEDAWKKTWDTLKSTAQSLWDDIKGVISNAVDFIKGIINGLIGVWNSVAGAIGLPTIGGGGGGGGGSAGPGTAGGSFGGGGDALGVGASSGTGKGGVPGFAKGGVLGGYSPGIDNVEALLSPGEGILVPEAVQGLGADFVHGANHFFSQGRAGHKSEHFESGGLVRRFAQGGIIPGPIGNAIEGAVGVITGQGSIAGKAMSSIAGALGLPDPAALTAKFMEWINKGNSMSGFLHLDSMGPKVAGLGMQMMQKAIQALQSLLAAAAQKAASAAGGAIGGAVKGLSGLIANALKQAGIPATAANIAKMMTRIQIESSGNPNAVNNWDINAQNGTPSMGLAQITTTNFAKYGSGNILNPQDNLNASANYIKAVYGGNIPTGAAYALGTPGATSGWAMVGEQGPEMINFRGGESVIGNTELSNAHGSSAGDTNLHMPITVNGNLDRDAVEKLNTTVVPQLRIMLAKGTGSRIG